MGRRHDLNRQPLHHRPAWSERNLDHERSGYLSVNDHYVLVGTCALGVRAAAVSHRERFVARGVRDLAVASSAEFERTRRVAWCCSLGTSPGAGRIGGLDHGNEEHRIRFVFSPIDPVLCEVAERGRNQKWTH